MSDGATMLALELSTTSGSVALRTADGRVTARELSGRQRNSAELFDAIGALLKEEDLRPAKIDAVAISVGPGSFTGLRVAVTIARMLAATSACRVYAIPTHEAIAVQAFAACAGFAQVAVMTDAGRGRMFVSAHPRPLPELPIGEAGEPFAVRQIADEAVEEWLSGLGDRAAVSGNGVARLSLQIAKRISIVETALRTPRASTLIELAARRESHGSPDDPNQLIPLYVRSPECEEVFESRKAAAREKWAESKSESVE